MATYPLTQGPYWRSSGELLGAVPPVLPVAAQGAANGSQPLYTNILNVDATQKYNLGTVARFRDDAYGEVEAIYLPGVAALQQYDAVVYEVGNNNLAEGGTGAVAASVTRTVAASRGPLAVALSNPTAAQFGWFAVKGSVPVSCASAGAAGTGLAVSATAGQLAASGAAAGDVLGAITSSALNTPAAGYTICEIDRPNVRV
jgi:hypothetical protein